MQPNRINCHQREKSIYEGTSSAASTWSQFGGDATTVVPVTVKKEAKTEKGEKVETASINKLY